VSRRGTWKGAVTSGGHVHRPLRKPRLAKASGHIDRRYFGASLRRSFEAQNSELSATAITVFDLNAYYTHGRQSACSWEPSSPATRSS